MIPVSVLGKWLVGWQAQRFAMPSSVRTCFTSSSSSDANACRSVRESSHDFPAFFFFEEGGLLCAETRCSCKGEYVGSLTFFQGSCLKASLKSFAMLCAVSVSVMHDQCRKYNATCTMHLWRAGRSCFLVYRHGYAFPLSC